MYRIAICEDEPLMARENETMLCRVLKTHHFRRDIDFSVSSFSTAEPLLAALRKKPSAFHLLLLDIGLAQENGMELASRLRELNVGCSIIYITSYAEYMPDSFATHPLEYLMKPVDEERLKKAIKWDLQKNYRPERIALPVRGGLRRVEAKDILYAEAVNHRSTVRLPGEEIPLNLTFRELLSLLPGDTFCRCHHSFVVNLEHVLKQTAHGLLLDTETELPVSRTYQQEIAKQFVAFLK